MNSPMSCPICHDPITDPHVYRDHAYCSDDCLEAAVAGRVYWWVFLQGVVVGAGLVGAAWGVMMWLG